MKADASPTKEFFVDMITRDITLQDCILDLLDNCVDGARRLAAANGGSASDYSAYEARIDFSKAEFLISDNCGGISLKDARERAFRFGRSRRDPKDGDYSIGLYGIGMKRAMLKIGRQIQVRSETEQEAFECDIDVDAWMAPAQENVWDFELDVIPKAGPSGTTIRIGRLYEGVAGEFDDAVFLNSLRRIIARDYSMIIAKGLRIFVGGTLIAGYQYEVRESEDFIPYRDEYHDGAVKVEIIAGMAALPPDSAEPGPEKTSVTDYFGWFVVCNDRVILAADKTDQTVWGVDFPLWHSQYNGFLGMIIFTSADPKLLPWTTTKTDVDSTAPIYRRAVSRMRTATEPWVTYTNTRKVDLDTAKAKEVAARSVPLFAAKAAPRMVLPVVPRIPVTTISYVRPKEEVRKVAEALGRPNMTNKDVGIETFLYYLENEVED